ncbi:DNA cytosine methyltransferase [Paraburkholderia ginsengisoli]|uniref:DNA (cytosine-5-)-methyltransferase n=1 Tax=Paraburkholderia ginsengisoli TaxID=311231 RepID=A0A7T4N342_9BURK|nr:DNA cytosine methyltransferase [Paraburkholderia ginsengisoli]QQC64373.1 DNA cytosine methyltransferase [Paraburkholderia ginsengisoli]
MTSPSHLRYGSVCSGIEAVSLAWRPLGLEPAWFSEIDPFPCAVLAHHYPTTPNLGDLNGIARQVSDGTVCAPDILVGGTPCQSFSVAGARRGMSDPRGALTLTYVELANAIDHVRQRRREAPAVFVWENVPGVLSDSTSAFGCLLGALAGAGRALQPAGSRWTHAGCVYGPRRAIAWRVLDAQFFGVAQRRRRVFLVASGRDGFDPAAVLFEPGGMPGHLAPGWQARQDPPPVATASAIGASPRGYGLTSGYGKVTLSACFGGGNTSGPIERAACLTAPGHRSDFDVETFAVQSVTGVISHTLDTANGGKGCGEDGTGRGVPIVFAPGVGSRPDRRRSACTIAFAQNNRGEVRLESGHGELAGTLMSKGKPGYGLPLVASVALRGRGHGATAELGDHLSPALRASQGGSDKAHVALPCGVEAHFQYDPHHPVAGSPDWSTWRVRRLMPMECERLQGMPDNYTLVPYRGKPAADSPRYKAIGNSMAVPCVAWLGRRLLHVLD